MTITAQRLLTELGKRSWSGFLPEDMVFDSNTSDVAKTELNVALRYLINREDFPFKKNEEKIFTVKNVTEYQFPKGQISTIYNILTLQPLDYLTNCDELDKSLTGEPTGFWVEFANPKQYLRFYPTPDNKYYYNIVYSQYQPILATDGSYKTEFDNATDVLNIPENLELLFMDCLILRTMITQNKNQNDENYLPLINEFNQSWSNFIKLAKPVKLESKVVW